MFFICFSYVFAIFVISAASRQKHLLTIHVFSYSNCEKKQLAINNCDKKNAIEAPSISSAIL